jgi:type IX secretion system PorP/SprF family membrane protein
MESLERLDPVDNIIPENKEDIIVPDANFGINYQSRDFYLGLSAAHLLGSKLAYPNTITPSTGKLNSHFFITSGYTFDLSKKIDMEPSVLIKYVKSAPLEADINVNFGFYERFFIGGSYRIKDAVAAIVKVHITKSLRIAYSYDFNLSNLGKYSQGAHEVMLSYGIKLAAPASEKEIHPRYYF